MSDLSYGGPEEQTHYRGTILVTAGKIYHTTDCIIAWQSFACRVEDFEHCVETVAGSLVVALSGVCLWATIVSYLPG